MLSWLNVSAWKEILDAHIERCLRDNLDMVKEIVAMMADQSYSCILYPEAAAKVDRIYRDSRRRRPHFTEDQRAAFRVVG